METALGKVRSIHIVGIAGTLMGSFAIYLKRMGYQVSGSDSALYPPMSDQLQLSGIQVALGYKAENISNLGYKPDLVILGNVLRSDNPEARSAIDGGFAYSSLPEAIERFFLIHTRNIVVAGTHGKTTTTSLMAHVFALAGAKPSYFIGGVPKNLPFSFHVEGHVGGIQTEAGNREELGKMPPLFILEGDEYDTAFWDKVPKFFHYRPNDAVLTSVEFDHADIYQSLNDVVKAFEGLFQRIGPARLKDCQIPGSLTLCLDFPEAEKILTLAKSYADRNGFQVCTYSTRPEKTPHFLCKIHSENAQGIDFEIIQQQLLNSIEGFRQGKPGDSLGRFQLPLSGEYNALNATSVFIVGRRWGLPLEKISEAFKTFQGVKRRQEERGEVQGRLVIDDFAHHPTAVKETLKGLRAKYQGRRLLVAFEPRSATSRRAVFQKDYAEAFSHADLVFIGEPYDQSRIAKEDRFSSALLVEDLKKLGVFAEILPFSSWPESDAGRNAAQMIWAQSRPGDALIILSNGGFYGIIPALLDH